MNLNESAIKVIEEALDNGQECEVRRITQNIVQVTVLPREYFTRDMGYPMLLGQNLSELQILVKGEKHWTERARFCEAPYTWLLGLKLARQPEGKFNIQRFPVD